MESLKNPIVIFYSVMILVVTYYHLYAMNTALKYYNQIEFVPILKSSVIICNILCGGIIMGEFSHYTQNQIFFLSFGSLISILGILIILKKHNMDTVQFHESGIFRNEDITAIDNKLHGSQIEKDKIVIERTRNEFD